LSIRFILLVSNPRTLERTAEKQLEESVKAATAMTKGAGPAVSRAYQDRAEIADLVARIERRIEAAYGNLGPRIMEPGDSHSLDYKIRALAAENKIDSTLREMLFGFVGIRNAFYHTGAIRQTAETSALLTEIDRRLDARSTS
jgi:hypothetical protein